MRRFWHSSHMTPGYDPNEAEIRVPVDDPEKANLIGSELKDGLTHMPVLDIDHPCKLVESETPGHFHLYIDVPMHWGDYEKLLTALAEAGVCEVGYVNASIERKQTFVASKPWKKAMSKPNLMESEPF